MFKVGIRLKGADKSFWLEYESVNVGPTAVIGYESDSEFTIFPLASVDFIDVKEES